MMVEVGVAIIDRGNFKYFSISLVGLSCSKKRKNEGLNEAKRELKSSFIN